MLLAVLPVISNKLLQKVKIAKADTARLFSDLTLPGKDGWELLADILDNPTTEALPCIAVTAYHNSKLREQALRAGFIAYFPKPLDGTLLGRELDRIM